jgi:hypothetical protein
VVLHHGLISVFEHFGPWRWDHHVVTKHQPPFTQWHGTTSQKNTDLILETTQVRQLQPYDPTDGGFL